MPAALLPLLFLTCGPGADADSVLSPPWPGLPAQSLPSGWTSSTTGAWGDGLSEVSRARQWLKIPAQAVVAELLKAPSKKFPADDPQGRNFTQDISVSLFLSSPAGAIHGYGVGLPTTVHAVAFGAVPIQASLRIEQLRDDGDLPVALQLRLHEAAYRSAQQVRPGVSSQDRVDLTLTGHVRVRLTALSVDGVDVGLGDCVSAPIALDLKSATVWENDPLTDPNMHDPTNPLYDGAQPTFTPGTKAANDWLAARGVATLNGGAVSGDIDVPAFSHCLTRSGEDLSPLLTSSISGPGNPVTVGIASVTVSSPDKGCFTRIPTFPFWTTRGPFLGDPSDCDPAFGPPTLDYPARGD